MSETTTSVNKTFGAQECGKIFSIPLECVGTYNVRKVVKYAPEGVTYESLIRLALGTDEQKAEMVRIIQEDEQQTLQVDPKAQTIVMLANSIFDQGQLQPIVVRQTGAVSRRDTNGEVIEGEKRYGYMIVMGGRRTMAIAYLYALGMTNSPTVVGKQVKMSKEEALSASIAENLQRADFTEREIGEFVALYRDQGKKWAEIAQILRRSVLTLRDTYALVRPEAEDAPENLAEMVDDGTLTKGQAVQIARGVAKLGDGGERLFRSVRKTISVKAIEALIDETPRDETGMVRLQAFAEVLNSTVEAELAASDERAAKVVAKAELERKKAEAKAIAQEIEALKSKQKALTSPEEGEVILTSEVVSV